VRRIKPIPSIKTLHKKYGKYINNPGLKAVREWGISKAFLAAVDLKD